MTHKLKTRIRYRGWITAYMSRSAWGRQVDQPSWPAPFLLWRDRFRPRHFTEEGARLYGFAKRFGEDMPRNSKDFRKSYVGHKLRAKHHAKPLIWSGRTMAETRRGYVKAFIRKASYTMPCPVAALPRPSNSQVDLVHDLTEISQSEAREMLRAKERAMIERIRAIKGHLAIYL